jgi:hypothetical protein
MKSNRVPQRGKKTGERSDFGIYKIEQNKNFVQFGGGENGLSPVFGSVWPFLAGQAIIASFVHLR